MPKHMITKKEVCSYYGQIYDNVKHISGYLESLQKRYDKEVVN